MILAILLVEIVFGLMSGLLFGLAFFKELQLYEQIFFGIIIGFLAPAIIYSILFIVLGTLFSLTIWLSINAGLFIVSLIGFIFERKYWQTIKEIAPAIIE